MRVRSIHVIGWVTLALATASACESAPPLERSCAGERVELCGAHEYAEITAASLGPERLTVADFSMNAQIRVELDACPDAPAPHEVRLQAIVPDEEPADGGTEPVRVIDLLVLEGPVDGVIDVEVANPFIATVPAETDILLRFTARSTAPGGCASGALEIPYRTGPMRP